MGTKAFQTFLSAVNDTYRKGSSKRKALTTLATNGLDINKDREAFRVALRAGPEVFRTLRRQAGL